MPATVKPVQTGRAPAAIGPYSQAISAGDFVFTSGQIPVSPADGTVPETVEAQAKLCCENLKAVLKAAGTGLSAVVKTTVYLQSMDDFAAVNAVYASFFKEPYPARSCVEVARLPKGVRVEIEAVALR